MKKFINDLFKIATSKAIIIISGIIGTIITARYIDPSGNGLIASLVVYPDMIMTFGALGIGQSATHLLGKKKYTENRIRTSITQIWLISSTLSLILCFVLVYYLSNSNSSTLLVILSILPIPLQLFINYNSGIFLGKNDISTYNRINWIPSVVTLLSYAIFVFYIRLNVVGALISMILGPLVMFFVLVKRDKFFKNFSFKFDWDVISSLVSLGITYAISLLIINLNYKLDIIMLNKIKGNYITGVYSKGVSLVNYLWQIPNLLSTIVFARSANAKDDREFSYKTVKLLKVSLIIVGIFSVTLMLLSKNIVLFMYGKEYYESIKVINILLPGVLLLTIFRVLNMDLAGRGRPWISMYAMLPGLIINVIANYYLIPLYGATGAAISSTISYSIAALIFLFVYSHTTRIPIKDIIFYTRNDFLYLLNSLSRHEE